MDAEQAEGNDAVSHRDAIATALGASEAFPLLAGRPVIGPESLAMLAKQVSKRLSSSGGRPTDPNWAFARQVPFSAKTWDQLGAISDAMAARGSRVAKGQLAAMLLEESVERLLVGTHTSPEALDAFMASRKSAG